MLRSTSFAGDLHLNAVWELLVKAVVLFVTLNFRDTQSLQLNMAQELLRYQRSIEEAAQHAWRAKFGGAATPASKAAKAEAPSAIQQRLSREDSAFEPVCGYREANKKVLMSATAIASLCLTMQWYVLRAESCKLWLGRPKVMP